MRDTTNTTKENATPPESKNLVVFAILRESECAECKKELLAHDFLVMEDRRPLCLACADLDHLVYSFQPVTQAL